MFLLLKFEIIEWFESTFIKIFIKNYYLFMKFYFLNWKLIRNTMQKVSMMAFKKEKEKLISFNLYLNKSKMSKPFHVYIWKNKKKLLTKKLVKLFIN